MAYACCDSLKGARTNLFEAKDGYLIQKSDRIFFFLIGQQQKKPMSNQSHAPSYDDDEHNRKR